MKTTTVRFGSLLVGAIFSLLTSCSSMQIQTAADPQTDLTKYRTYAWAPPQAASQDSPRTILDQTLKSSIDEGLQRKGLDPAPESSADLLVSYYGATRDVLNSSPAPYYGYPTYPYPGTTYVTREGSLTLQLIDPRTKRIVWQGTATEAIDDTGATQEQVASAVDQLLERYPKA